MAKHSTDILTWARRGAEARWQELQTELASLKKAFPDLATARRTAARSARGVADMLEPAPRRRRRSKMSAAQKKAVSVRMKTYWAERRKAQAKVK